MKYYYKSSRMLVAVLTMALIVSVPVSGDDKAMQQFQGQDCSSCHAQSVPTIRDHKLNACPRSEVVHQSFKHSVNEAPDIILIDLLANEYQEVIFDHKLHAEMAEMDGECGTCHHYSPPGRIPACKDCHSTDPAEHDPLQPGLKEAYHRQCLACHRDWSHDSQCNICHLPTGQESKNSSGSQRESCYPTVKIPVSMVYNTSKLPNPVVTFQHIEHLELFDFDCIDCHQNDDCSNCHDQSKTSHLTSSSEQVNELCSDCHDLKEDCTDSECVKCHDAEAKEPVFHQIVGNTLPDYCEQLGCSGCHPER